MYLEKEVKKEVAKFVLMELGQSELFLSFSREELNHVHEIGTTLLMRHYKLQTHKSGSFVEAFLRNDLQMVFSTADRINQKVIYFYLKLIHNIPLEFNRSLDEITADETMALIEIVEPTIIGKFSYDEAFRMGQNQVTQIKRGSFNDSNKEYSRVLAFLILKGYKV